MRVGRSSTYNDGGIVKNKNAYSISKLRFKYNTAAGPDNRVASSFEMALLAALPVLREEIRREYWATYPNGRSSMAGYTCRKIDILQTRMGEHGANEGSWLSNRLARKIIRFIQTWNAFQSDLNVSVEVWKLHDGPKDEEGFNRHYSCLISPSW